MKKEIQMFHLKGCSGFRASIQALLAGSRFKSSFFRTALFSSRAQSAHGEPLKQLLKVSVLKLWFAEKMHQILTETFGEYFKEDFIAAENNRSENYQKAYDS